MLNLISSEVREKEEDFPEDLGKIHIRGLLLGVNSFNYQPGITENINLLDVQISCLD